MGLIPFSVVALLSLVTILPYPFPMIEYYLPYLTLMGVYFWSVEQPDLLPLVAVFSIGVVEDALTGGPLGLSALLLIILRQFAAAQRRFLIEANRQFSWIIFMVLCFLFAAVFWLISSIYLGQWLSFGAVMGRAAMTAFLYPVFDGLFRYLNTALQD